MKYKVLFFSAVVFALFSCSVKQIDIADPEESEITIRAFQEGAAETRTTLVDNGTQVYWEPSDEIKVFFRGSGNRFISHNSENERIADFSGTLNVVVGQNEGAFGSNALWGLYPYRADASSDGESVTTTLPAEQTGRAGSFAKNTHITLAKSNSFDLAFYNVCSGVRFSLTQEGIKRVTFEGNDGEALAGKIRLAFENGIPTVKEISDPNKVITMSAPNGGTFQTGQWYYIEALPGALSGGYKMAFYKESEFAQLSSSSSVTLRRGVFGSLAEADKDLMFKPTGGGEGPNPDGFIQFEDPIAKYACIEKFDSNGDGEVSYAEAAAVTSLDGLFTDWDSVTSFDEIRYFTSVTSTQNVFTGLTRLKRITIPDHVTTLGSFKNCSALETVILPSALVSLPQACFEGCSSLKSVTLPKGLTSIPDGCFESCAALTALALPSTIITIGQYALSNCTVLTGINLPSGIKTIGNYAFQNCRAIMTLDLPASLTTIGSYAFLGCSSLASAVLSRGVSLGQNAFASCTSLASVVLPEDMTSLPAYCFQSCTKLATITWPTGLTTIGKNAFEGCRFEDNDNALQLPPTVTTIGSHAFGYLHHLILPSTSAISIASDSFIADYTFLYVPSNMLAMYKLRTNWNNYADRIRSISDYPVSLLPGENLGEAVDMGLSVKWASWNVGASAPEEYGVYFAWGEIEPSFWFYDWSSWRSYKWCNGSLTTLTKYNTQKSYGIVDDKTTLDMEDDAAHANWGGSWRMPTLTEIEELINNCDSKWTTENGVNGRRFTSKKEGYTDKSIFLPAAGCRDKSRLVNAESVGYYWSSSLRTSIPTDAHRLGFSSDNMNGGISPRDCGFPVRPVCPKD